MLTNHDLDAATPLAVPAHRPAHPAHDACAWASWPPWTSGSPLRYAIPAHDHRPRPAGYIRHHLTLAGRTDTLFSDDAVRCIHDPARGLPRAVNNLAATALLAACAASKTIADEKSARTAIAEKPRDRLTTTATPRTPRPRPAPAGRGRRCPRRPHRQ